MRMISTMLFGMGILVLISSCSRTNGREELVEDLPNTVVLNWNEKAYEAMGGAAYQHSLMASRVNAMTQLAMHDALNSIIPVYETYVFSGNDPDANPEAAAASAAHTVLAGLFPEKQSFLDSALQQSLLAVTDGEAKKKGMELGRQAGQAILADRANDGSDGNPISAVAPSTVPGVYQAVPPMEFVFAPYWDDVKLFGLERKDQFRSAPHPSLESAEYAQAFQEVKETGVQNSATRTAEQSAYAKFWYEFSEAGWNRIARTVTVSKDLNLYAAARLLALVNMALADSYIAGWDAKNHYNFWRPYTAIRNASTDNNDATSPDASWVPAEATPPVQDYPSTHSALGNAAATVMARLLGDNTPFSMTSPTALPAGSIRSFSSFAEAARENADSRVRAGIHFRFACDAGLDLGHKVGNWMVDNYLKAK